MRTLRDQGVKVSMLIMQSPAPSLRGEAGRDRRRARRAASRRTRASHRRRPGDVADRDDRRPHQRRRGGQGIADGRLAWTPRSSSPDVALLHRPRPGLIPQALRQCPPRRQDHQPEHSAARRHHCAAAAGDHRRSAWQRSSPHEVAGRRHRQRTAGCACPQAQVFRPTP